MKVQQLWLFLTYVFTISCYTIVNNPSHKSQNTCFCAIMNGTDKTPLMEYPLQMKIKCDKNGTAQCQKLCTTLAEAAKEAGNGPQALCEQLTNAKNLTVSIHSKICDDSYTSTGFASKTPICCENGKVENCI